MKIPGLIAPLLAALLLCACEPTPDPTQSASAQTALPAAAPANPLLDSPPDVFLAVLGDCGRVLFEGDSSMTATDCLATIRQRAAEHGLPELTDAQLGDVNLGYRWRFEQDKRQKAGE